MPAACAAGGRARGGDARACDPARQCAAAAVARGARRDQRYRRDRAARRLDAVQRQTLRDAGRRRWQGVRPGMPVRGPDGLIGRVLETGPAVARILLLSDPDSVVPSGGCATACPRSPRGAATGWSTSDRSRPRTSLPGGRHLRLVGDRRHLRAGHPVARIPSRGRDTVAAQTFARPDTIDFAIVERPFLPIPPRSPRCPNRCRAKPQIAGEGEVNEIDTRHSRRRCPPPARARCPGSASWPARWSRSFPSSPPSPCCRRSGC